MRRNVHKLHPQCCKIYAFTVSFVAKGMAFKTVNKVYFLFLSTTALKGCKKVLCKVRFMGLQKKGNFLAKK